LGLPTRYPSIHVMRATQLVDSSFRAPYFPDAAGTRLCLRKLANLQCFPANCSLEISSACLPRHPGVPYLLLVRRMTADVEGSIQNSICCKDQIAFWLRLKLHVFSNMKMAARCVIAVVMLAAANFAFGHPFKSKIITTAPLMITVGDDQFLNIKNFSQEGGIDRGVVAVTFTGENGGTADVLTAIRIDLSTGSNSQNFPEIGNNVIIAGPAQVTVAPVLGATLSITFRKESDGGSGGGRIF